jgi:AmiR/NasT family two-component response regulator
VHQSDSGVIISSMDGQMNDAGTLQEARVDMLMAVVRDTVSSLRHASAQLEVELAGVLSRSAETRLHELSAALELIRTENAHLREALEGRAVIEQAKGMLMARHGCDADTAFAMLTEISRVKRRKVRQVASTIVTAIPEDSATRVERSEQSVGQR